MYEHVSQLTSSHGCHRHTEISLVYITGCVFWPGKLSPFLNWDVSLKLPLKKSTQHFWRHISLCFSGWSFYHTGLEKNAQLKSFVWSSYSCSNHHSFLNSQLTFILWNRLWSFIELLLRTNIAKNLYFLLFYLIKTGVSHKNSVGTQCFLSTWILAF